MEKKALSAGIVLPGVKVSIRKLAVGMPNGADKAVCQTGETGEIAIKGYNVMRGYYRQAEATAAAFDQEGWFRTGDMGFLDQESHLHITGRLKDMIIRSGENIAPAEIEEVLAAYPLLEAVKVIGVPDPVTQEEIAACMVPKPEAREHFVSELPETLRHVLKQRLSAHKMPMYYLVFRKFPVSPSGKVDGRRLKEMARQVCQSGVAAKGSLLLMNDNGGMFE